MVQVWISGRVLGEQATANAAHPVMPGDVFDSAKRPGLHRQGTVLHKDWWCDDKA
jgi:hypothetical protein